MNERGMMGGIHPQKNIAQLSEKNVRRAFDTLKAAYREDDMLALIADAPQFQWDGHEGIVHTANAAYGGIDKIPSDRFDAWLEDFIDDTAHRSDVEDLWRKRLPHSISEIERDEEIRKLWERAFNIKTELMHNGLVK